MRRALVLVVLLLLPGCMKPKVAPEHFLVDGPEPDAEPFADLLWADFRELNGSVVLSLEFENMSGRIPEFTARFGIERDGRTAVWFLRTQANLSKPPSYVEYVVGRVEDNRYVVVDQVCATTEITRGPWVIQMEAEHRITGLSDGPGRIEGLSVQTGDFEGTAIDFAETSSVLQLRGGPNPHEGCPLHAERPDRSQTNKA